MLIQPVITMKNGARRMKNAPFSMKQAAGGRRGINLTSSRVRLSPSRRSRQIRPAATTDLSLTSPTSLRQVVKPAEYVPANWVPSDSLQLYLREIGQVKLLTPSEEITLARRIKRGDKRAREHMIKANLRLVVKIAREYEGLGLPLLDLINEGNIGLMKGVERFDPRKGAKLSTYASWWIKQGVKRALANQSKTVRLPVHVVDKVAHIRRAEVKLRETLGRDPTDEELAHEVDLDARRVRRYRDAARAPVSLDAPVEYEGTKRVDEVVADPNAAAPFDRLSRETDAKLVREVLGTLDRRESRILGLRFGLDDDQPRTLEEIGVRLGVTRERIRQIQEQALLKLRARIAKRDGPVMEDASALAVAV
jgi:RNA polymerase primary sigma factor